MYRSLHLIVEVQLRTIAMDFWASLEHKLRYKKNIPDSEAKELADELVECAQISASLDKRMEEIRTHIASSEERNKDREKESGTIGNMLLKKKIYEKEDA